VQKHSHFQTPPENPSIQTHLVLLCCIKRLYIFGPKGAIQIRYYYYYHYYYTLLHEITQVTKYSVEQNNKLIKLATNSNARSAKASNSIGLLMLILLLLRLTTEKL